MASPAVVARRLTLAGMRPIDSIVDASNYVMLELGQPTHPYDLDRLAGHGLRVRSARPGEELVTLDGVTRVLGGRPAVLKRSDRGERLPDLRRRRSPGRDRGDHGRPVERDQRRRPRACCSRSATSSRSPSHGPLGGSGCRSEASVRFERGVDP